VIAAEQVGGTPLATFGKYKVKKLPLKGEYLTLVFSGTLLHSLRFYNL